VEFLPLSARAALPEQVDSLASRRPYDLPARLPLDLAERRGAAGPGRGPGRPRRTKISAAEEDSEFMRNTSLFGRPAQSARPVRRSRRTPTGSRRPPWRSVDLALRLGVPGQPREKLDVAVPRGADAAHSQRSSARARSGCVRRAGFARTDRGRRCRAPSSEVHLGSCQKAAMPFARVDARSVGRHCSCGGPAVWSISEFSERWQAGPHGSARRACIPASRRGG
jgi:hypothetical protein